MDRLKQMMPDQLDSDELTRSPQMNAVIKEANKVLEGTGELDLLDLRIHEVEMLIDQMEQFFKYESRFQEKTNVFLKESEVIEYNFERVRRYLDRMKKYFDSPKTRYIEEGLKGCRKGFKRLFEAFDNLKAIEEKRKKYSKSPYLNEIYRVATAVLKGTLTVDTFRERIDGLIRFEENFFINFQNFQPTEDERLVFEENHDEIMENIQNLIDGLKQARVYLSDSNPDHIHNGLEKARKAANYMAEFEQKLKEAREAPKVKYCFKCGAQNPRTVKYCVKCNFNFPPLQMKDESTIDVRLEEGGIKETGHVMTENLAKLASAVEDVRRERITVEEFAQTLDWFANLIEKARIEIEQIEEPKEITPEAKEAFENFKNIFWDGIENTEAGLTKLYNYTDTHDPTQLQVGLEEIMQGGDQLYQVKMTSDQLKANMEAQKEQNS